MKLRIVVRRKIHQGLLVIMAALSVPGIALAQSEADQFVLGMRDAYRRGDSVKLTALLPQMRGHVLEPLVSYWESKTRLESATVADMRSALARHPGTYWEDRLRNDWLLQLGKQRDWANFSAELPLFRMNDDRQVQCYALMLDAVERRTPPQVAADQVLQLWLQQRDADDGCATAAQSFLNSGHLKPAAAWERARLTMELGRTRAALQAVELLDPDWASMVETIAKDPAKYLDEKITAIRPRTKELVTLAMIRLASKEPAAAALEMDRTRWKAQLTQEERSWIWGVIGKRSAQKLQGEALTYYANGQDRYMHGDLLEWKVRAGIRAGAWGHVLDAIGAMNAEQQRHPDWIYWRARALEALKQPDAATANAQARTLFASIASSQGFYEQLAQEALGRSITVPSPPSPLTAAEIEAAIRHPGLQRALAAMRLGLRSEGVREWNYIVKLHTPGGMGERELHQHQRADDAGARLLAALPDAAHERRGQAGHGDRTGPCLCVRPDAPGKPLCDRSPLGRGRLGLDAGHAGHGALDGQEDWPDRFQALPDQRARHQHRHRHRVPQARTRRF
jgi:soluble lytic murein transglycosylase